MPAQRLGIIAACLCLIAAGTARADLLINGSFEAVDASAGPVAAGADPKRPGSWRVLGWAPWRIDWWATSVQFVGTLFFNVSTFAATRALDLTQAERRIWAPDVLGSIAFLVASALAWAEAAMTAHIVYEAWDPDRPATCSAKVINEIIRGRLGFHGLLMSDDLDMKALQYALNGGLAQRAMAALEAGVDVVLQCSGVLKDMEDVVDGCGELDGISLVRARAAEVFAKRPAEAFDAEAGWARFKQLMQGAGVA